MLSIIGLALDLVGAGVLSLGLFRPTTLHDMMSGTQRDPHEAAADQSYGATGFLLLGSGFLLQGLAQLGVGTSGSTCEELIAGLCALLGGLTVAFLAYGVMFRWRFPKEVDRLRKTSLVVHHVRWKRRGLKFWHYEVDKVDE